MSSQPTRQALICPICRQLFQDPCVLLCGHSFCERCIAEYLAIHKKCPYCRTALHSRRAPRNWMLAEVVEEYAKSHPEETGASELGLWRAKLQTRVERVKVDREAIARMKLDIELTQKEMEDNLQGLVAADEERQAALEEATNVLDQLPAEDPIENSNADESDEQPPQNLESIKQAVERMDKIAKVDDLEFFI